MLTPLSPLMALIALAIKLDDGGPVLYVQDRVGKDSKTFRCYKFRTFAPSCQTPPSTSAPPPTRTLTPAAGGRPRKD